MLYAYPARIKTIPGETVLQFRDLPEGIAGGAKGIWVIWLNVLWV